MKFFKSIAVFFLILLIGGTFHSCNKDDVSATLNVYGLYNATDTSCMIRGTANVIGDDIIEAGYLKTSLPESALEYMTVTNCQRIVSTSSLSDFTVFVNGLSSDSTYRLRVYAKSADSVYYGALVLFKPIAHSMNMVQVQGGTFQMGATSEQIGYADTDEYPVHSATIPTFLMGRTEVTNAQFAQFLKSRMVTRTGYALTESGVSRLMLHSRTNIWSNLFGLNYLIDSSSWTVEAGFENRPVVNVTWYGAYEFCRWAGGRLPYESEWEWAARGGINSTGKVLSGGDSSDVNTLAWYYKNIIIKPLNFRDTQDVGSKSANELGLYDMSGNAWEWVNDWYVPYNSRSQNAPTGMSDEDASESGVVYKTKRGGGWADGEDGSINELRVSNRESTRPDHNQGSCGFRMAKTL